MYDHFPADFLPDRFLCGLCQKLLREPRVLGCLHTFCRACSEQVAATVTHDSGSTSIKMPPSIGTVRVIYGDREKGCPTSNHPTELPAGQGGTGKLPQHFVVVKEIENIILQHGLSLRLFAAWLAHKFCSIFNRVCTVRAMF
uniref:RING-type domain-containing protein n=1 Tax=Anopheles coluzzii TaxID=1518534 RepID=A0A8W7PWV1_ANOCL